MRAHDSQKFLESFYFQYGHASIADLGHTVLCFEGISELAATEIEEEPLWDGQAKSFALPGFLALRLRHAARSSRSRQAAAATARPARSCWTAYRKVKELAFERLAERLPRPADMKPEAYQRNLAARAFDVARYLLFWGVPTNVGQVTSIRTLEKQIRRLGASEYRELRELGREIAQACAADPDCQWDPNASCEPLAPTLARHAEADEYAERSSRDLRLWARQNLGRPAEDAAPPRVDLLRPTHIAADIAATLLYPVTDRPFRELYEMACEWGERRRAEVLDLALASRTSRDENRRLPRGVM